jgi:membrane-associated PAP2 superfamily phosphatase
MAFRTIHYILPLLAVITGILFQYTGVDIWFAHLFYDEAHHNWLFKDSWLTSRLLHRDGQLTVSLIGVGIIIFAIATMLSGQLKRYRREALFLVLASLTGVAIVGELKRITHIYSPWDLLSFGGKYPHVRLFDPVPGSVPVGHAFPAGHAAGGFALLCFYFLFRIKQPARRYLYLMLAVFTGLVFGIDQDIRGAHMLSHDLFSFAICWSVCMAWSMMFFRQEIMSRVAYADSAA